MDYVIRRARASDAENLTALMHASSAYAGEYASILRDYAVTPEQIDRDLVWLAETGGRVLGFYSLTLSEEPELDLMFVADGLQGTGLGRGLFAHMRAQAAALGIDAVRIVAHPPAAGFYETMGAVPIGISPPFGKASWSRPVLSLPIRAAGSS
jgi:GNAT superfamily N-acetyltransferase